MKKPLLQIALDNTTLADALITLKKVGEAVDIIEVGTILLLAEGKKAVEVIKKLYPNKIVLADGKIADAGNIVSNMMFEAGADLTTVICCADLPTAVGVLEVSKKYKKDMQIELTGKWDFNQAVEWKEVGVQQVVYHRSRDAQAAGVGWGKEDLNKIEKLCEMGFKVTVTGGITQADLDLFKHLPIYIMIAGRSLRDAKDPYQATVDFQIALKEKWNDK